MFKCIRHLVLIIGFLGIGSVLFSQSGFLEVAVSSEHPSDCATQDGSITIDVNNGTPPFEYSIDGGANYSSSNNFAKLGIGSYIVFVRDANEEFSSFIFTQLTAEGAPRIDGFSFKNPERCGEGGTVFVDARGGSGDLEYSLDGGVNYQADGRFTNVPKGTYSVVVRNKDASCPVIYPPISFTPVEPINLINAEVSTETPSCTVNDGKIDIDVNGNLADYEFSIDRGATFSKENWFMGLGFGNYIVVVRNIVTGCQKEVTTVNFDPAHANCDTPETSCNLIQSQNLELFGEDERRKFCLGVPIADILRYEIILNGQVSDQPVVPCREEGNESLAAIILSVGVQTIELREVGICTDIATVTVTNEFDPADPNFCNSLIEDETINVVSPNDVHTFCLNIPVVCYEGYTILVNGQVPSSEILACTENDELLGLSLGVGTYQIDITHNNGTCMDNGTIVIMPIFDPSNPDFCNNLISDDNQTIATPSTITNYCLNFPLDRAGEFEVTVNGAVTTNFVSCSEGSNLAALPLPQGTHTIELNHSNGTCSDAAIIRLLAQFDPNNPEVCSSLLQDEIIELPQAGQQYAYCLNIPLSDINNFDVRVNGVSAIQNILACSEDPNFAGLLLNAGTNSISVTHSNGICTDNATVQINQPVIFNPNDPTFCNSILESQTIILDEVGGSTSVCLNIPRQNIEEFQIMVNQQPFTLPVSACPSNNDLAALTFDEGLYFIEVIHSNGTCTDSATIRIDDPFDPTDPEACARLISDGTINVPTPSDRGIFCLNISNTEIGNFTITLNGLVTGTVACSPNSNKVGVSLPVGTHAISLTHSNGICVDQASVTVQAEFDPNDPVSCNNLIGDSVFELTTPGGTYPYCLNIPLSEMANFTVTDNGVAIPAPFAACASDPTKAGINLAAGTHVIEIRHSNGQCNDVANITINLPFDPNNPELCSQLIADGTFTIATAEATHSYCLNFPLTEAANFTVLDNGVAVTVPFVACASDPTKASIALTAGMHVIELRHSNGICNDQANVTVSLPFDPNNPELCSRLIEDGSFTAATPGGTFPFCLNIPLTEMANFTVLDNGVAVAAPFAACTSDPTRASINLTTGTHVIEVRHSNGICVDQANITIISPFDPNNPDLCSQLIENGAFTLVDSGGTFLYCLNIPVAEMPRFTITVEQNGQIVPHSTSTCAQDPGLGALALVQGDYTIRLAHENGICLDSATVRITNPTDEPLTCSSFLRANDIFNVSDCNVANTYCIGIPVSLQNNFTMTVDGVPISGFVPCGTDPNSLGINLTVGVHQLVLSSDSLSCSDSATVTVRCLPPTIETFMDTLLFNETDTFCIDTNLIAGTIVSIENACPERANGIDFRIDTSTLCVIYSSTNVEGIGEACIVICNEAGECSTIDMDITVLSEPMIPFLDSLRLNETDTFCIDTTQFPGTIVSIENVCPERAGTAVTFTLDTVNYCVIYTAVGEGTSTACIRVCDDTGNCTTTEITIMVMEQRVIFRDSIPINTTDSFCIDTTLLEGPIVSIENTCPQLSGEFILFEIDTTTYCVTYTALEAGTETACIRVCDSLGNCFTTELMITAVDPRLRFDTTISIGDIDTFCLDTTLFAGPIVSIRNVCEPIPLMPMDTMVMVDTMIMDSMMVDSMGMDSMMVDSMGMDSMMVDSMMVDSMMVDSMMIDSMGMDSMMIDSMGMDSMMIDSMGMDSMMIDSMGMDSMMVDSMGMDSMMVDSMGMDSMMMRPTTAVRFTIDTASRCIIYEGLAVGIGQACIEICNAVGQCDTFIINVNVALDSTRMPIAVTDVDTTDAGEDIIINVLANDTLFTTDSLEVTIEALPANGEAIVNPDGTITYTPNDNFCDTTDIFMYQVCNVLGCDTARVEIFVRCTEVLVLNGFSPNGDGVNDSLIIQGLGAFPENRLQIFDRRGTRVFNASPYMNNFAGVWEGKDLPDGIYFYLLDLGDGMRQSGYIVIRR